MPKQEKEKKVRLEINDYRKRGCGKAKELYGTSYTRLIAWEDSANSKFP
jgi:hypothetical protein